MSRFAQAPRGSQWRSATGEIWTVFERLPFGRLHIVREDNSRQGEVFQRDFLAHPGGGALAIVAHVDRSWASAFHGGRSGPQVEVFTSALKRLIDGHPVGYAMDYFGSRHAELSADLAQALDEPADGEPGLARDRELADLWTTSTDARYPGTTSPMNTQPSVSVNSSVTHTPSSTASTID